MQHDFVIKEKIVSSISIHNKSVGFHWHNEILEIIILMTGNAEVTIAGESFKIKENDIIFINKMMPHKIEIENRNTIYLVINIDLIFFSNYVEYANQVFYIRNPNDAGHEDSLKSIRRNIAELYTLSANSTTKNQEDDVIRIIEELLSRLKNNHNYIRKSPLNYKDPDRFNRIWHICRYLLDNHQQGVTLSDVANIINISGSYLSQSIKQESGLSFEEWLNMYRAEHAARLLLERKISLTRISQDSGFSDPRYFNKYFQLFFENTPREYREKNKKEGYFSSESSKFSDKEINLINKKIRIYKIGKSDVPLNDFFEVRLPCIEDMHLNTKREYNNRCLIFDDLVTFYNMYSQDHVHELQNDIGFKYFAVSIDGMDTFNNQYYIANFINITNQIGAYPLLYIADIKKYINDKHNVNFLNDIIKVKKKALYAVDTCKVDFIPHDLKNNCIEIKSVNDFQINSIVKSIFFSDGIFAYRVSSHPYSLIINGLNTYYYSVLTLVSLADGILIQQKEKYIITAHKNRLNVLMWTGCENKCDFLMISNGNERKNFISQYSIDIVKKVHVDIFNDEDTMHEMTEEERGFYNKCSYPSMTFYKKKISKRLYSLDENRIMLLSIQC